MFSVCISEHAVQRAFLFFVQGPDGIKGEPGRDGAKGEPAVSRLINGPQGKFTE